MTNSKKRYILYIGKEYQNLEVFTGIMMIMETVGRKNAVNIIDIFVKIKFGVKLTDDDKKVYNNLDDEEKKLLSDLINNNSFIYEINNIINNILKSNDYSKLEKMYAVNKINKKIKKKEKRL